ncbi:hypothetical protein ABPG72_007500 [Tetrahymena utriculariae]
MSSGTSYQDFNQMAREAPDQFKESISHKFAIGRSLSAKIMRSGMRPCDIAQIAQISSEKKEQSYHGNNICKDQGKNQNSLEQIMIKRGKINELSERNMKKILQSDFYYNDLNEIRSINEFLYIKNTLAVNQNTKRILSMREDLKKKQKQIQQIIQKEQNLMDQEDQVKETIDFAIYHKYLSGQKMQLNNQSSQNRNCSSSQSARYNGRIINYDQNNNQMLLQSQNFNSPFNYQYLISPIKQVKSFTQRNSQNSYLEQYQGNSIKKQIFNHQQITESAKDDSTHYVDQESQSSHTIINQMSPLTVSENVDSYKSTATQIHENNQIRLFNYDNQEHHLDSLMKLQKLSTISERDSEVILQKDIDNYRSMMALGSSQNTLKTNVIDINNTYELFQTKSPNTEQSNMSKSQLSPHSNYYQQKNQTMPARNRNSQYTNEESINEGSQMVASNYLDQLNSKYPFNNKIVARSQSAHTVQKQSEKYVSVPTQTNQPLQSHIVQRRKSSQQSVYLHTQQQIYNPSLSNNLQYIASLPVYKCSFKKKCKHSLNNAENKNQDMQQNINNYYSQYTMKEADKFLLNQQIVNNFKQKQNPQQFRDNMMLYNSIKTAKVFNDKIDEALQLNSKEYDQKYNQFSTQTNFAQRQTRSSCENRIQQTILKDHFNKNLSPKLQTGQMNNTHSQNQENTQYCIKINDQFLFNIAGNSLQQVQQNKSLNQNESQNKKSQDDSKVQKLNSQQQNNVKISQIPFCQFEADIFEQKDHKTTPINQQQQEISQVQSNQSDETPIKFKQLESQQVANFGFPQFEYNTIHNYNIEKLLSLQNNFTTESDTQENTQTTATAQKQQNTDAQKNKSQKLTSSLKNSPIKICNFKTSQAELFNTKQNIEETQLRIIQNLKKIDLNQKKDRNYLAKMNMINQEINKSKSLDAIKRNRSESQSQNSNNSPNNYPKRARLSRAQISKMFKTSEQIQMHKEVGLFNRITYNNFIQKNNKNKILLKNCNYVEYYQ